LSGARFTCHVLAMGPRLQVIVQAVLTGWHSTGTNRIDRFQRVPSELRKYLEYMAQIKTEYGSVMRFVVKERLCWGDGSPDGLRPRGGPFEYAGKEIFVLAF
jgi:hypothetical protein